MAKGYLIDTNAIIEYTSGAYPDYGLDFMDEIVNSGVNISAINKIEVLSFTPLNYSQKKYFKLVIDFVNEANIIYLTEDIIAKTIEIRKKYKTKLPDAIIASSALNNKLILITRNTKDFRKIEGLRIINPHKL